MPTFITATDHPAPLTITGHIAEVTDLYVKAGWRVASTESGEISGDGWIPNIPYLRISLESPSGGLVILSDLAPHFFEESDEALHEMAFEEETPSYDNALRKTYGLD